MNATKILVVDDDRELVELLSFALLGAGMWPLPAYTSAQAMDLLQTERPALGLLDVHLGGESGFELLRAMRRRSGLPIIMMSAITSEAENIRALDLGADDYVSKLVGMGELLARIRARLRRRHIFLDPPWARTEKGVSTGTDRLALDVCPCAAGPG